MAHDQSYHTNTTRIEAFSDGVFAIAITLLVLEITVPKLADGESLGRALGEEWPSFFGYCLSFITIGIMWMNHHTMWNDIERFDHTCTKLNLLLLLCISFVPFPTAVLADYLHDDARREAATLFYGGAFTAIALCWNALWLYASASRRLIDTHVSDSRISFRTRRNLAGPIGYGGSLPLALISPWLSLAIYVGMALLYLAPL